MSGLIILAIISGLGLAVWIKSIPGMKADQEANKHLKAKIAEGLKELAEKNKKVDK